MTADCAAGYESRLAAELREARRMSIDRNPGIPLRWCSLSCACDGCLDADYLVCARWSYMRVQAEIG